MSTFLGRMKEYREISIDRFDGPNLHSSTFFLSHKHEDHMGGLSTAAFNLRLQTGNLKLYVSDITKDLLMADERYQYLEKNLVSLPLESPQMIPMPDEIPTKPPKTVQVTLLSAGHCPGSVMFLFEGNEGTVLYTGDIRLEEEDLWKMEPLHCNGRPKHIDSLYLDTTFCIPQAVYLPKREESWECIIDLVKEWLNEGPHRHIVIHQKASLGYEHLFDKLHKEFKMKIHVDKKKHAVYQKVPKLSAFSTDDPSTTRIHACKYKTGHRGSKLPCGYAEKLGMSQEVRNILVTTMFFTRQTSLESTVVKPYKDRQFYRVCYSFHSSYSEIRDMIFYLRPSRIIPNVIPLDHTIEQIQARVDKLLQLANMNHPRLDESQHHVFGALRIPRKRVIRECSSDSLDFGETQIKKSKMKQNPTAIKKTHSDNETDSPQYIAGKVSDESYISSQELQHKEVMQKTQDIYDSEVEEFLKSFKSNFPSSENLSYLSGNDIELNSENEDIIIPCHYQLETLRSFEELSQIQNIHYKTPEKQINAVMVQSIELTDGPDDNLKELEKSKKNVSQMDMKKTDANVSNKPPSPIHPKSLLDGNGLDKDEYLSVSDNENSQSLLRKKLPNFNTSRKIHSEKRCHTKIVSPAGFSDRLSSPILKDEDDCGIEINEEVDDAGNSDSDIIVMKEELLVKLPLDQHAWSLETTGPLLTTFRGVKRHSSRYQPRQYNGTPTDSSDDSVDFDSRRMLERRKHMVIVCNRPRSPDHDGTFIDLTEDDCKATIEGMETLPDENVQELPIVPRVMKEDSGYIADVEDCEPESRDESDLIGEPIELFVLPAKRNNQDKLSYHTFPALEMVNQEPVIISSDSNSDPNYQTGCRFSGDTILSSNAEPDGSYHGFDYSDNNIQNNSDIEILSSEHLTDRTLSESLWESGGVNTTECAGISNIVVSDDTSCSRDTSHEMPNSKDGLRVIQEGEYTSRYNKVLSKNRMHSVVNFKTVVSHSLQNASLIDLDDGNLSESNVNMTKAEVTMNHINDMNKTEVVKSLETGLSPNVVNIPKSNALLEVQT